MTQHFTSTRIGNHLLAQLPDALIDCLKPNLQRVPLVAGQRLFHADAPPRAIYFPESGLASLVVSLRSGEALDVDVVGNDGVAGLSASGRIDAMACEAVVQIEGSALRIDADIIRRQMASHEPLHALMSQYAHLMLVRSMQSAACVAFHSVKERCARWLLVAHDLVERDELPLTHDRLARLLGVRRVSVTLVLGTMVAAGLIGHSRGRVVIKSREALERASCECYTVLRGARLRLLGF